MNYWKIEYSLYIFWPEADSKKKISFQVRLSFILFMDFFFISRCHIFLAWSRRWKLITFTSQHVRYYGWYIAPYWFWFCGDNQFYDICSIFRRSDILDWRDLIFFISYFNKQLSKRYEKPQMMITIYQEFDLTFTINWCILNQILFLICIAKVSMHVIPRKSICKVDQRWWRSNSNFSFRVLRITP